MRVAICDDEEVQQRLIEKYLREWAEKSGKRMEAIAFPSAESFLFHWEDDKEYDLLILDIEMGNINGMELALRLRARNEEIPILFVSGYEHYMAQGYEVSALHYLMKPLHKEKLFQVLDRLKKEKKPEEKLRFQAEEGTLAVPVSDIWYIEAADHRCILVTTERQYEVRQSFGELKKLLEGKRGMVVCHRSYIVNLQHVSAVMKAELVMDNHVRIPVSRSAVKQVNEAFIRNYTGREA